MRKPLKRSPLRGMRHTTGNGTGAHGGTASRNRRRPPGFALNNCRTRRRRQNLRPPPPPLLLLLLLELLLLLLPLPPPKASNKVRPKARKKSPTAPSQPPALSLPTAWAFREVRLACPERTFRQFT